MRKIFLAIGVVLIVSAVFVFLKPQKITNFPSSGASIVMFGDSLTYGVGATSGNDIPSILSRKIGQQVINMGVPGETSAQGLARVGDVMVLKPKVVILLFGGNDFLRRVPISETFSNIDTMVVELQKSGAVVVLAGIRGGILSDPYDKNFSEISKNRGTLYVSNVMDGIIGHKDLMSDDSIHPNDAGYGKIADRIYKVLVKGI